MPSKERYSLKLKILKFISGFLFIGSFGYIYGQAGSLECDMISIPQFIVRSGIGLVVLGFDAWLINHLDWKEDVTWQDS